MTLKTLASPVVKSKFAARIHTVQRVSTIFAAVLLAASIASAQQGTTVIGTVTDPTQMAVPAATVEISNTATGFHQTATSDATGAFRFENVPPAMYDLVINKEGFAGIKEPLEVEPSGPISAAYTLKMAGVTQSVDVTAAATMVDTDPSAHTDANADDFLKLPRFDPASGLSSIINNSTGGTAGDANGFFHPLGDHAQVSFVVDGQPISDQQSKAFSTQLPANAIQSMQLITGAPDAQYGDKSSMVVAATTKSGLGLKRPAGSVEAVWGSFGTYAENTSIGMGTPKFGNFLVANAIRTGHFLDTPEFLPIHDVGNSGTIFDRVDYVPGARDTMHMDLFLARNWFQVPNSYDQLKQDQKQRVATWSVAPGWQHVFGSASLLTVNPFVRRDQVNYYGSRNPFNDTPVTASQLRFLTNYGVRSDLAISHKAHNLKFGMQVQQTRLAENFSLAVTDPAFNPVCLFQDGSPATVNSASRPPVINPDVCVTVNGLIRNPNFQPGLLPYDLTQGGSYYRFSQLGNISQFAIYATDEIKLHDLSINIGLRDDQYSGLISKNGIQPRLGLSYHLHPTETVLRAAYSRTFETPFNENLLLSSSTGSGGLAQTVLGARSILPIAPGMRNQFNAGLQQKLSRYAVFDADYFWKFTHNGYDFDVLFNTPIAFPIAWHNSKVDGVTGRLSTINWHGAQASWTFGHSRARYFPPEVGGLILQRTASVPGVFRIDHDQAYQQTVNLRYQFKKTGPWATLLWRYDSGLAVTGVNDAAAALALTAAQQTAIGLACDGTLASYQSALRTCRGPVTSTLLTLPQTGAENNDHNPDRVKPRNLFDLAVGTDNLLRAEKNKVTLRVTITNLTNRVALYNFLSTFSGTHFVAPRTYQVAIGYVFQ